ncbi:MAG: hypothetical protein PHV06_09600 [bacterium]|nr:hypothetical protein [bacterium]
MKKLLLLTLLVLMVVQMAGGAIPPENRGDTTSITSKEIFIICGDVFKFSYLSNFNNIRE